MSKNLNKFIKEVMKQEGKKSQVTIGNMRETFGVINRLLKGTFYKSIDLIYTEPPGTHQFKLKLLDAGISKLNMVKTIKDLAGLGLKEAKDLVDQAPSVVLTSTDKDELISKMEILVAAGGTAEVQ